MQERLKKAQEKVGRGPEEGSLENGSAKVRAR